MAELYTSLQVSPRKKRQPSGSDDGNTATPKKLRTIPPTPPPTTSRDGTTPSKTSKTLLPPELDYLFNSFKALQHALAHALATSAMAPTSDSGIIRNILNHVSMMTYSGFSTSFEVDDLKRLCWIWEWDGKAVHHNKPSTADDDDNPFLDTPLPTETPPSEWTRGGMGFLLSPASHYSKTSRKRVPAYGIGIEVEIDIDKDMRGGVAAAARWTAATGKRSKDFLQKLETWIELHDSVELLPIPMADIPDLSPPKVSALTRTLAAASPSAISTIKFPEPPSSPSSPSKKKAKSTGLPIQPPTAISVFPTPKINMLFPSTPSRRDTVGKSSASLLSTSSLSGGPDSPSKNIPFPSTPTHQKGTPTRTPSTARRDALLERVRQRSLTASPTKPARHSLTPSAAITKDEMLKMSQDATRRRCLLGRLAGLAESIWMLFSNPSSSGSATPSRKRRALPLNEVVAAAVKSSPVPISTAEANESIAMLLQLCPFFLKKLDISGSDWLEMSAPTPSTMDSPTRADSVLMTPTKKGRSFIEPPSPGRLRGKDDSAQELLSRSPKSVKRDGGILREVREIIRRELELDD